MLRNLLCLSLAAASVCPAETAVTHLLEEKMYAHLRALDSTLNGVLGVATIDLTSGRVFVYNAEAVFPTASSIKLPIMVELFRQERAGRFHFTDSVTLNKSDNVGGSTGPLQDRLDKGEPVQLTVEELINAMIQWSDNSATNKLIDTAGMDHVNALIREWGFRETKLRRKMMDVEAAKHGNENVSTPLELARIVDLIQSGRAGDANATQRMLGFMKKVKADMRQAIPADVEVASKPGDLDAVRCEVGVVYLENRPFIVSVMSTYLDASENPVRKATEIVFQYFSKLAQSNEYGRKVE